jgi:uncharacterized protein (DUF433 family)
METIAMENPIAQHITKTGGICGGRACIAGHRIRVMDIAVLHEMRGMSPEEIAYQYPSITLADVYAALAYYLDNREEIEQEFRKDEEWAEWVKTNIPSKVRERTGG